MGANLRRVGEGGGFSGSGGGHGETQPARAVTQQLKKFKDTWEECCRSREGTRHSEAVYRRARERRLQMLRKPHENTLAIKSCRSLHDKNAFVIAKPPNLRGPFLTTT